MNYSWPLIQDNSLTLMSKASDEVGLAWLSLRDVY